ncbi:hypothetical protein BIW11_08843 [Tropilaelaps mercedesae]|uniref:Mannosyltransferase n=1 Tax=Tropilaelaps mercedesae TaxID=418985 RepID=A0A1V9XMU6_9ACAR|nr:hypothetical protein BIW11_08843 [Tropilaelaps mercedesae]
MARKVDGTTKMLLALRVASVLVPQYGYIHADEFFQSTEVTSRNVLGTDAYLPWEFTTKNPIRSAVFVHLFAYVPYQFMRFIEHTPYLRLVLPRLVACTLSFLVDVTAFRIKGPAAVRITASSYLALTYFTRTFNNLTETILFSLLLLMSMSTTKVVCTTVPAPRPQEDACNGRSDTKETKGGNTIATAGFFNRPTFVFFAIMPVVHRFWKSTFCDFIGSCVRLTLLALPAAGLFVLLDSLYYRGWIEFWSNPLGSVVVTPINFLLYNGSVSNLANHGLHPHWLHLLVNIPILFGVHSLFFFCDIYRLLRRPVVFDAESRFLLGCMLVPALCLSLVPHQEPRFLLPLLLPFALLHSQKVFRSSRSRFFWYSFNFTLFIFFGFLHQASVVPTQMYSGMQGKVLYYQTYMPPRHLGPVAELRTIVDLKEVPLEDVEDALRKHHEGHLVYPAGAEGVVAAALQNVICSIEDGTALWPHFTTEFLSTIWQRCGLDLNCLVLDSMALNRIRFHCESVL